MFRRHEPPVDKGQVGQVAQRKEQAERRVVVDHNLCFFCGACVAVCPPDAIFLETAFLNINDQTCTLCERCVHMCPVHALSMAEAEPMAHPE